MPIILINSLKYVYISIKEINDLLDKTEDFERLKFWLWELSKRVLSTVYVLSTLSI